MHAMKQSGRKTPALRALTPFAVMAGVELAIFWPLIQRLTTALHDRFDTMLNTWILTWQARELVRAPLSVFNAPIFHPLPDMLALSEIIWPAAPMTVPILAASGNPILVYNLTFLGTVFLAAVGMYLLALYVTRNRGAALLAGIFYAFSPYQFGHIPQVQLLSIGWLPLTLLYLERFWAKSLSENPIACPELGEGRPLRRAQGACNGDFRTDTKGRRRDGLMLALFMAAQTLSAFYFGFQIVLVVGLYVLVRLLLQPRGPTWRRLGQLLPWLALSGLLILPFALPYLRVRAGLGLERSLAEAAHSGANLAEFFLPRNDNPIYPTWLRSLVPNTGDLFPGVVGGLLALLGLIVWPKVRHGQLSRVYLIVLALVAWILALGPRLKLSSDHLTDISLPFAWLFQHVPGMTVIRAPGRFSVTLYLVLALFIAAGTTWLLGKIRRPMARGALVALLIAICLAEFLAGRETFIALTMPSLSPAPPAYAWLAQQSPGVLLELPLTSEIDLGPPQGATVGDGAYDAWSDLNRMRYQFFQTAHWQPIVDGYSGFRPPHHRELGLTLARFPDERSVVMLRGLGVTWVLVHSEIMEAFQPGRAAELRTRLAQAPGIEHVQDFGPEWLYRVQPAELPAVTGDFWNTAEGHAGLTLRSAGATETVIPPGTTFEVNGSWTPLTGGQATAFALKPALPLIVGEGSNVTLDLPWPATPGGYRLHLEANGWDVPAHDVEMEIGSQQGNVSLLPIRAAAFPEEARSKEVRAGQVSLGWRLLDRPEADVTVRLRLVDAAGQEISQDDQPLGGTTDLANAWHPGQTITTTHSVNLPAGALGVYSLEASLLRSNDPTTYLFLADDGAPVETLTLPFVIRPERVTTVDLPPTMSLVEFGESVYLLESEFRPPTQPGQPFEITADWTTAAPLDASYTIFAHLLDATGQIIAQQDQQPLGGRYPTTVWTPGEVVSDTIRISVPAKAAGEVVCLRLGMYDLRSLERLPRRDAAGDFWQPTECWTLP